MKYTFKQFQAEYPDDAACLASVMKAQFGGTELVCPGCGERTKFHLMTNRRAYACQLCGHHIYPCVGTIFEGSRTKLTNWFFAMYLMTSTRHGVAAKELERQIGCTYKCAWRMAHKLRKLMAAADYSGPLSGHVEIDETFIGGKQTRDDQIAKGPNKAIVFGMLARDTKTVRAGEIPNVSEATVLPIIRGHVMPGSMISTDEAPAYNALANVGYEHGTVNHSKKEYVRGKHHVNSLEGYWAQLKRSIRGTHIHVSPRHLWKYVSEFNYRWNMRHSHEAMFSLLVRSFSKPIPQDG